MFITLLIVTFLIAIIVSLIVVKFFDKPIEGILKRLIEDSISYAWQKYLKFAIYVVGISSGVRIWELEKYLTPQSYSGSQIIELTYERWILEVYRTVIETLQGVAWLLLVFFVFALIAYVMTRASENRFKKLKSEE
ncbi:MAG: hypothetical protein KKA84_03295 [Bacteroidetes bacterium]|nr:hypothetical protein [Bacteroidota bacterium]